MPCSGRGDEAQTERYLESPHVVAYDFEIGSDAAENRNDQTRHSVCAAAAKIIKLAHATGL